MTLKTVSLKMMLIIIGVVCIAVAPAIVYAAPSWKTYTSADCGMELDYPVYKASYLAPKITADSKNVFEIKSLSSSLDDDSISTTIAVDCSGPVTPLTEDLMEPLLQKALHKPSENPIVNDYDFQMHQTTSLNFLQIDGEQAANFIVGGLHGISVADAGWADQVIVTNHGDKQYKIDLFYSGSRVNSDFGETFGELDDHIIESIKFTS